MIRPCGKKKKKNRKKKKREESTKRYKVSQTSLNLCNMIQATSSVQVQTLGQPLDMLHTLHYRSTNCLHITQSFECNLQLHKSNGLNKNGWRLHTMNSLHLNTSLSLSHYRVSAPRISASLPPPPHTHTHTHSYTPLHLSLSL